MYRIAFVLVCLVIGLTSNAYCQEAAIGKPANASVDQMVGAGIALKLEFILTSSAGPLHKGDSAALVNSLKTISNDVNSFSDTNSGRKLRDEALRVSSLLQLILTEDVSTENKEYLEFMKQNELDRGSPDPSKIVRALHNEILKYVSSCDLPVSILHFNAQVKTDANKHAPEPGD